MNSYNRPPEETDGIAPEHKSNRPPERTECTAPEHKSNRPSEETDGIHVAPEHEYYNRPSEETECIAPEHKLLQQTIRGGRMHDESN